MLTQKRPYNEVVALFAANGAKLLQESITSRYHGLVLEGRRMLEPGYIPPDKEPRVLIISYYPNSSDLDKPGTPEHERIRLGLEAWKSAGTVDAYRGAYKDWLSYLDRIPFHKSRTKPILDAVGLRNEEIGWLPFIKAPMAAGSSPGSEIMEFDIDATWDQIRLVVPKIVWIQGVQVADRVRGLVKERITDRILPAQSVSQYLVGEKLLNERRKIVCRLAEFLELVS